MGKKLDAPVPENYLKSIGRITVNFAWLEMVIATFIGPFLGKPNASQIVTTQMSFNRLVASLSSLCRDTIEDSKTIEELDKLLKNALQAEEKRNLITHSLWAAGENPKSITRIKTTARVHKGINRQSEIMTVSDIDYIADFIAEVASEILDFFTTKVFKEHKEKEK